METQSYEYRPILAPVAQLAARRSHNPKVASSILAGSIAFFIFLNIIFLCGGCHQSRVGFCPGGTAFGWMAERSKALVLGTSLLGGVGSNPTPIT